MFICYSVYVFEHATEVFRLWIMFCCDFGIWEVELVTSIFERFFLFIVRHETEWHGVYFMYTCYSVHLFFCLRIEFGCYRMWQTTFFEECSFYLLSGCWTEEGVHCTYKLEMIYICLHGKNILLAFYLFDEEVNIWITHQSTYQKNGLFSPSSHIGLNKMFIAQTTW